MNASAFTCGGYQKPASIHNRAAQRFGELLGERVPGLSYRLIGSILDELGRPSGDLPKMVAGGELDFCYMSTVRFTGAAPELTMLELPFLVKDRETVYGALDGEYGETARRNIRKNSPFRVLGYWDNGFRHLTNSVRPIRRPEDCHGLKIRTQTSELHAESFRALGFEPIAIDIKEFTETIASGRVDAQDNPLTNIYNFGVHRHHPYITLSGHFFGASLFICNEARYQGWTGEVRAAVDAAARAATTYQRALAAAEDTAMMAKLGHASVELIELAPAERGAFVAALKPIVDRYRKAYDPQVLRRFEA